MLVVSAEKLRRLSVQLFEAAGVSKEESAIVVNHLVDASLCGVDSHGIVRVPEYLGRIMGVSGYGDMYEVIPGAEFKIERDSPTIAVVDGGWGFGQVVARKAMELAIAKAKQYGVGSVAGRNVDHVGRAAEYTMMAAEEKMIGAMFVKVVPVMSAIGGKSRLLGNNPLSVAIPGQEKNPIVVDIAMSVVAGGKVIISQEKAEKIPEGWVLDKEGHASTDPSVYMAGGSLVPFGGHKGYALGVVMEVLGGILSGAGALSDYKGNNAFTLLALNIEPFIDRDEFTAKVDKLENDLKSAPKAPGSMEIVVPGEPEFRTKERRLKEGIPITERTWSNIGEFATRLKVPMPSPA